MKNMSIPSPACRTAAAPAEVVVPSAVNWILAPDSTERAPLDRWCAGVGPIVTASLADTGASPASSLVVVTWNTNVGGGDIAGLVDDLRAGRFTDGAPVDHFVLLLQEVYRAGVDLPRHPGAATPRRITGFRSGAERVDIVETARLLGLELYYVPSMANGRAAWSELPEDRGNAILSTLPLRDLTAIELPYEGQRRVAAAATVSGTSAAGEPWELRVVSVHLDNRSRLQRLLQSLGSGRARQARALVKALGAEGAAVLGGDLNTWSASFLEGAVAVLHEHFPVRHNRLTEPTFSAARGLAELRLDHLMFRLPSAASAETRRLGDRRGSDHHPLIGHIRFAGPQATESPERDSPPRS
jgi:endonuclease/exonuclease/phosphatase family metal-dependent hydrolase